MKFKCFQKKNCQFSLHIYHFKLKTPKLPSFSADLPLNSRKKLKTQGKNSKLKIKTQFFGTFRIFINQKYVQKISLHYDGNDITCTTEDSRVAHHWTWHQHDKQQEDISRWWRRGFKVNFCACYCDRHKKNVELHKNFVIACRLKYL